LISDAETNSPLEARGEMNKQIRAGENEWR
jgi:hypothetical protein